MAVNLSSNDAIFAGTETVFEKRIVTGSSRRGEGRGGDTSNAGRQCDDLGSLSLADVRARGHPEVVSARLVQFGRLVGELIGRHLLTARLLRVVRLRVNGVLGDDAVRLAGWPPRNQDRFGRHDESLDRDRRFGGCVHDMIRKG